MNTSTHHDTVSRFLVETGRLTAAWMQSRLPALGDTWWDTSVIEALSTMQQAHLPPQSDGNLERLDLAALLRVLNHNWYPLSGRHRELSHEARNFAMEMRTIRNRWAHASAAGIDVDQTLRDLDTIQRFNAVFSGGADLQDAIQREKTRIMSEAVGIGATTGSSAAAGAALPSPKTSTAIPAESENPPDTLRPGVLVRLVSDDGKIGPVMSVSGSGPQARFQVFLDNRAQSFYRSQIEPHVEVVADPRVTVDEARAMLTATVIRHPSVMTLYSLHAARIDFVPYQFRPALKFIRADRPRLLIADGVGVGKTIEAGLILRELQARQPIETVLIICPKPLVTERKWQAEMRRFDESFTQLDGPTLRMCLDEFELDGCWPDQHRRTILPFSLLDEQILKGQETRRGRRQPGLLDLETPPKFDLIIVDEAHHVRNPGTWSHRVVRFLCDHAGAVVFLTATPVQMGSSDLFVLLQMLRPDLIIDEPTFRHLTEPNPAINEAITQTRAGGADWARAAAVALERAAATPWGQGVLCKNASFKRIVELLRAGNIDRAGRVELIRELEDIHTLSGMINRTRRRDIDRFCVRKPETVDIPLTAPQQQLHDAVLDFTERALRATHGATNVAFMMTTLKRQVASCIFGLGPRLADILARRVDALGDLDVEAPDDLADCALHNDFVREAQVIMSTASALPHDDPKFDALLKHIQRKQELPNNKAMVFSCFRHTLTYLNRRLLAEGLRVGLIHGGIGDDERLSLRDRFSRDRSDPAALDVMLFSEVGSEGLDYQFCDAIFNYDLPWNPMRIEQRIGRIDRRGQQSEAVAIVNFVTTGTIDAAIYHRCLVRIGVFEQSIGECEAILGDLRTEIHDIANNLKLSETDRERLLEQMADNEVRRLQEQRRLEDREHELFGVKIPQVAADREIQAAENLWLTGPALRRLICRYLSARTGTTVALRGTEAVETLRLNKESRHRLLDDLRKLPINRSSSLRAWRTYLEGDEPNCLVTFDGTTGSSRPDAHLLTPLHPLVLQAAHHTAIDDPVEITVGSAELPADWSAVAFAIYAWEMKGLKSEIELVAVCEREDLESDLLELLATAEQSPTHEALTEPARQNLDSRHFARWERARQDHVARTREIGEIRRESLKKSVDAQRQQIADLLANTRDARITRMRQSQLARIETDLETRLEEIDKAEKTADVIARLVIAGVMESTKI